MTSKAKSILTYFTITVVCLSVLFWALVQAKSFLAPISVAALLAMVVLPICRWFEGKGLSRGWASLVSDLLILLFFAVLALVLSAQVKSIMEDWPQIKERVKPKIEKVQEYIAEKTGISVKEQDQKVSQKIPGDGSAGASGSENPPSGKTDGAGDSGTKQNQGGEQQEGQPPSGSTSSGGSMFSSVGSFISAMLNFLGTFLLIFVYIFFFLFYRAKFRKSILKMVPSEKQEVTQRIISESTDISQNYLFGRLILIMFLAIIYGIGLSISGVKHAVLISVLAAVLSLIPYIGNIIGYFLALSMAFFSGSGLVGAIGVSITFAIAQFVESYILEPYIVGDKVNLNPVFTILVVVLGGAVWGVVGMLIAIPALGIAKVVFDHIPVLSPLGYLFGNEDIGEEEEGEGSNFFKRTKKWALNKFKR